MDQSGGAVLAKQLHLKTWGIEITVGSWVEMVVVRYRLEADRAVARSK